MTQLSNERLKQYIKNPLEYGLTRSEQMEISRELLERRKRDKQEPVAWTCQGALEDVQCGSTAMMGPEGQVGFEPLYAASPAPVAQPVQVPDELLSAMEEVLRISDRDHEAWQRAREGIAACRAAMLNEPVTAAAVPYCFVRLHNIIKERHHGRMPEEVQNAFDECAAMLAAAPQEPTK